MSSDASKQQSNVPAQAPHHEMRNAENSATFLLPRLRLMTENNPHLTLLDVGAGSGTITATLAKLIPGGRVIALDINPKILPRAQAVAEQAGVHNIKFQEGDVHRLSSFADNTFDVTFCHQVLTHVGAPWDALREMLRVTKPGGIVAVREGDFETESVWPELPGLLKFHRFVADSMKAAGGTSTAGRQLVSWALRAGGVTRDQIALSFSTWSYHSPSERATWAQALVDRIQAGNMREKGLQSNLTTEDDLEEMINAWREWMNREDASIAMMHSEIIIEKQS